MLRLAPFLQRSSGKSGCWRKVGKSEKRQTARKQQRSSGRIEVTNIALLPKFVRRSVQGRPRCLQARAPRCTECVIDVYCAMPRRYATAEGASCHAPPARRCRSFRQKCQTRQSDDTNNQNTSSGWSSLEIALVTSIRAGRAGTLGRRRWQPARERSSRAAPRGP